MNLYIVVEGRSTEKKLFAAWIPLINAGLSQVHFIDELKSDNFLIVSGNGYPQYFRVIRDAVKDLNTAANVDELVVSVDAEDMTYEEKYCEIYEVVKQESPKKPVWIVIQNFCVESWLLGNRKIAPRNNSDAELRRFRAHYDVGANDPELTPSIDPQLWNRSQFASRYLKACLMAQNCTYSKSNVRFVAHEKYLWQVRARLESTGHIPSFHAFLSAVGPR